MDIETWITDSLQRLQTVDTSSDENLAHQLVEAIFYIEHLQSCYEHWHVYYEVYSTMCTDNHCNNYSHLYPWSIDLHHITYHELHKPKGSLVSHCQATQTFIQQNYICDFPWGSYQVPYNSFYNPAPIIPQALEIPSPPPLCESPQLPIDVYNSCIYNNSNCTPQLICEACKEKIHYDINKKTLPSQNIGYCSKSGLPCRPDSLCQPCYAIFNSPCIFSQNKIPPRISHLAPQQPSQSFESRQLTQHYHNPDNPDHSTPPHHHRHSKRRHHRRHPTRHRHHGHSHSGPQPNTNQFQHVSPPFSPLQNSHSHSNSGSYPQYRHHRGHSRTNSQFLCTCRGLGKCKACRFSKNAY